MSKCIDNMEAYTNLTDHVFQQILLTTCDDGESEKKREKINAAKDVLRAIRRRNLYRCVGESGPITTEVKVRLLEQQPCS